MENVADWPMLVLTAALAVASAGWAASAFSSAMRVRMTAAEKAIEALVTFGSLNSQQASTKAEKVASELADLRVQVAKLGAWQGKDRDR